MFVSPVSSRRWSTSCPRRRGGSPTCSAPCFSSVRAEERRGVLCPDCLIGCWRPCRGRGSSPRHPRPSHPVRHPVPSSKAQTHSEKPWKPPPPPSVAESRVPSVISCQPGAELSPFNQKQGSIFSFTSSDTQTRRPSCRFLRVPEEMNQRSADSSQQVLTAQDINTLISEMNDGFIE